MAKTCFICKVKSTCAVFSYVATLEKAAALDLPAQLPTICKNGTFPIHKVIYTQASREIIEKSLAARGYALQVNGDWKHPIFPIFTVDMFANCGLPARTDWKYLPEWLIESTNES